MSSANSLPNVNTMAYGIIDRDFRTNEEVKSLSEFHIFTQPVAEIENVFLIESFLSAFLKYKNENNDKLVTIKNKILEKLYKELDQQAFLYAQAKLRFLCTAKYSISGKDIGSLKESYNSFCSSMTLDDWYIDRKNELMETYNGNNYSKVLEIYNNKGLKSIVGAVLGFNNYQQKAIEFLRDKNGNARHLLINHFPEKLVLAHDTAL